ncbi:hypothetical protein CAG99_22945 [Streptomyces marincola]|uniref:Uncharacterized protein n=1 Tax=Streptomyces marincola TaxID=2878388 RepID=A0A1W7D2S1_9ACTN|nr:hypothetical protein CAG99_22945 [Streptomyces marincola]
MRMRPFGPVVTNAIGEWAATAARARTRARERPVARRRAKRSRAGGGRRPQTARAGAGVAAPEAAGLPAATGHRRPLTWPGSQPMW